MGDDCEKVLMYAVEVATNKISTIAEKTIVKYAEEYLKKAKVGEK